MASSSKSTGPYAVFLSFRGTDVRNSFASHLYNELVRNGIHIFRDNEELRKGQDISMVLKAIEESCIAIIIFSEDYTSSWWCLEEVAKIMQCKEQKDLTVLPVFYKVDPKEVREGRASYAKGLAKHESKHGKDSKEMERWKEALRHAGRLSGWTLNDGDDESKVIQEIVKDILTRLSQTPFVVAEHPVGVESRVAEVKSMLNLESKDDVLMVGLWGQGGIGKTTLGRAIFNDISKQFDGSSFLANVREKSKDGMDLAALQEQLLDDILFPPTRLVVSDVARGKSLIPLRLRDKRVLVILDDVDDVEQLCALAGKTKWFGSGSRILVTTRDRHMLTPTIDRDRVYVHEVKALEDGEARALLSKHAFLTYEKLESRTNLLNGFSNHAKGLPLALEVLGSLLCGTTEDVWESILKRLSTTPNKKINNVLKVSYDGLEKNEQEIFLHVACFFKGRAREYTERVLDSCDLHTAAGFDTLIKRSLIRIEDGNLQMHDLIQSMGRHMVEQEFDDPRRRSRLRLYEDVLEVLSCSMGDCAVKAIVLELPELKEMCINCDAFTKMTKLSLLILRKVSFQGPICLPNELRWVEWPGYSRQIEFSAGPKKLVGLDMRERNVTGVVKQFKGFQQLKYLNFSKCKSLVRMPDLSCTPNLEELDLKHCKNLEEADESIADHANLRGPHCSFLLSGSKMPEWIFTVDSKVPLVPIDGKVPEWMQIGDYSPVEKCSVSLMVSKGSYKKFLGLALCVVALRHYSKAEASLTIRLHVNGKWRRSRREEFPDLSKCHIYIQYFIRDNLWGDIDFGQIAGRYAQLSLTVRGDVVAWGLRIICEPLENDLWIEILKNRLMDPHVLCEVVPGSADSKAESSLMYEDNSIKTDLHERLQDCQISAEEQS
ncbi:disease resistance protein RUN1-like [Rhodamnia argentea]|uniref:Disease resistance protein RUN1-like n=1 Tax=Rhodamnia argentea TaxID=178133 RepID=A0ABM3H4L3_9MYRT|nr:disease resistance protein RUN1-like [Rhodamnia argentea]